MAGITNSLPANPADELRIHPAAGPVAADAASTSALSPERRILLLDALRGAALLGVLLINIQWFAFGGGSVPDATLLALPTASLDTFLDDVSELLIQRHAIGVFTILFGVSFGLQMERLQRRGGYAMRIYARRLTGLLAIGLVHWLGLWSGDILRAYAVAGFLLLLAWRWQTSTLLVTGVALAAIARPVFNRMHWLFGTPGDAIRQQSPALLAERFDTFLHGGYLDTMALQWSEDLFLQVTSGIFIAQVFHALGRFMLGLAIARGRYFEEPEKHRQGFQLAALAGLSFGFLIEHDWVFVSWLGQLGWVTTPALASLAGHICNSFGVLAMTLGYIALFVLLWQIEPVQRRLKWLAPVGQLALTNYLLQTVIGFLLFFGFGLGLMGQVGVAEALGIGVAVFGVQAMTSQWWVSRFRFGPMEWLWRYWTYGRRPAFARRS